MEFVPAGNKCPSNSMGIVFPYPVGRATIIWSLSCASNADFKMSTWECSVTVIENLRISPGSHGAWARKETAFSNLSSVLWLHTHPLFLFLKIFYHFSSDIAQHQCNCSGNKYKTNGKQIWNEVGTNPLAEMHWQKWTIQGCRMDNPGVRLNSI